METQQPFQLPPESVKLINETSVIPRDTLGNALARVEASLSLFGGIDEIFEATAQLTDPNWRPELESSQADAMRALVEAQTGEHDAEYIALGELLLDHQPDKISDAVFSVARRTRDRTSRHIRQVIDAVVAVDEEVSLDHREFDQTKDLVNVPLGEAREAVGQLSGSFSFNDINGVLEVANRYKAATLSRQDAALLLGRSFKQMVDLFRKPQVARGLLPRSLQEREPELQDALELAAIAFEHSAKADIEYLKDTAAKISIETIPKERFRPYKNKRLTVFYDATNVMSLPGAIMSNHRLDNKNTNSIAKSTGTSARIIRGDQSRRVIDNLNILLEEVGTFVAENPSQEAMIEAIAVDEYKQGVLKRLRDYRSAHDHHERDLFGELQPIEGYAELANFSLARALTEVQTAKPEITPKQRAEYQASLELLYADYTLSNKDLRNLDPGLNFTNLLRNGFKSPTQEQLIAPQEPILAKELSTMLLALKARYQRDGEVVFDTWLQDLQAEQMLLQLVEQPGAHLNEDSAWIVQHLEALQKIGARNLPTGLYDMLTELTTYLDRLSGKVQPVAIIEPVVEVVEVIEPEPEPEPEPEVIDLPENLFGTAENLDFEIFPAGATFEEIQNDVISRLEREDLEYIDWDRLRLMVELRDSFIGQEGIRVNLYRSRAGSLATRIPYYALEFKHQGETVMVADNPQYGNATYIVREDPELGSWQEILQLPKLQVRELGGQRMIHADGRLNDQQAFSRHRQKIIDAIITNLTVRSNA